MNSMYGREKITTEEVMDKLNMFQSRYGKIDELGWWYLERISADAGKKFASRDFKEECQTLGVHLLLAALEHQEMNGRVKVTQRTLRTISHSLMVHARVLESYIRFALMYTTYHFSPVLPIKYLINEDGNPTTPFKFATGNKPSVSHLCVLFCPCVVRKATAHVGTKALNMRHQAQKGFRSIFVGIPSSKRVSYVRTKNKENSIFI